MIEFFPLTGRQILEPIAIPVNSAYVASSSLVINCSNEAIAVKLNERQDEIMASIYRVRSVDSVAMAIESISIAVKGNPLFRFRLRAVATP